MKKGQLLKLHQSYGDNHYSTPDILRIGASFKALGKKHHIRGMVDDKIVCRWWSRSRQYWEYECFGVIFFRVHFPEGDSK